MGSQSLLAKVQNIYALYLLYNENKVGPIMTV